MLTFLFFQPPKSKICRKLPISSSSQIHYCMAYMGAGGSAGSPLGDGRCARCHNGGGGIGGVGARNAGGSKFDSSCCDCFAGGGSDNQYNNLTAICNGQFNGQFAKCKDDKWFYVEDINGAGGLSGSTCNNFFSAMVGGTGAGGGGGLVEYHCDTYPSPTGTCCFGVTTVLVQGARGGFLGGGGGVIKSCMGPQPNRPPGCLTGTDGCCICYRDGLDGVGGCAGGSSGSPGTPGVVIIYW